MNAQTTGGSVRGTLEKWRILAPILVAALLIAAVPVVACADTHGSSAADPDGGCSLTPHLAQTLGVLGSETALTLVPLFAALMATFAALVFSTSAPARLVPVAASLGPPADPLHGRLRI